MGQFFTRERFGRPQVIAGVLLLVFLAQCAWLVHRRIQATQFDIAEQYRIEQGLRQWRQGEVAVTGQEPGRFGEFSNTVHAEQHSPMWYLIASSGLLVWPGEPSPDQMRYWEWLAVAPYFVIGALLGASLWYVARRLYGNEGGYIALVLFCFAPGLIRVTTLWAAQPEGPPAWGAFGAIFTAIAVAHTLYAPREVILWNWRRIILLALSFALAVGNQFSLVIVIPMALAFMLYVAPTRRGAAFVIWVSACVLASLFLFASYFFHPSLFLTSLRHADYLGIEWRAFSISGAYRRVFLQLMEDSPALIVAVPVMLATFVAWKRTRYFGNTAPLIVWAVFFVLAIGLPHSGGSTFMLVAAVFMMVFMAGVSADILEARYRWYTQPAIWGLLAAYAVWNFVQVARVKG